MTTQSISNKLLPLRAISLPRPGSLEPALDISIAPTLELSLVPNLSHYQGNSSASNPPIQRKLYLVPTPQMIDGENPDGDFPPKPSPLEDLPPLSETVHRYVIGIVEILGGRRTPMQLARSSHRLVYSKLLTMSGSQRLIPRIRRIYIHEPIEGVAETTVTLRMEDRVRALVLRFEGVDKRWLCTELQVL